MPGFFVPVVILRLVEALLPGVLDKLLFFVLGKPFAFKGQADPQFLGILSVKLKDLQFVLITDSKFHTFSFPSGEGTVGRMKVRYMKSADAISPKMGMRN